MCLSIFNVMTSKNREMARVLFVVALLLFSAFAGVTVYYNIHSQGSSSAVSSTEISIQNVTLSDYNAPAIHGTTQSNGTILYIPPTTEGNLGFHVILPLALASAPPRISIYLNGRSITSCTSVTVVPTGQTVEEGVGCGAPVTPLGSSNNVTIIISSPLISATDSNDAGSYSYQSMIVTTQAS